MNAGLATAQIGGVGRGLARTERVAGGGAWTPSDAAGLYGWWRASQVTGETPDTRIDLPDETGNGHTLSHSNPDRRPFLRTGGPNGKSYFDFDDNLTQAFNSSTFSLSQPVTIFLVLNIQASDAKSRFLFDGTLLANRVYAFRNPTSPWYLRYGAGTTVNTLDSANFSTWEYYVVTMNTTASTFRRNGIELGSGSVGSGSLTSGFALGGGYNGDSGIIGYMTEAGVYSNAVSAGDLANLETYLSSEYAI